MWSLQVITPPAAEPLDLNTEVLKQLRLAPFEVLEQKTALDIYIQAARALCETFTERQLITASYQLWMSSWFEPGLYDCATGSIRLPRPPATAVTAVTYLDTAGATQVWPAGATGYDTSFPAGERAAAARVLPAYGISWPDVRSQPGAIKIAFTAGYGLTFASVPGALRAGMLLIVEELYDRRAEASVGTIVTPNEVTSQALWTPYRVFW